MDRLGVPELRPVALGGETLCAAETHHAAGAADTARFVLCSADDEPRSHGRGVSLLKEVRDRGDEGPCHCQRSLAETVARVNASSAKPEHLQGSLRNLALSRLA